MGNIINLLACQLLLVSFSVGSAYAACVFDSWGTFLNPKPQQYERMDDFDINGRIIALKFKSISGKFAKIYMFLRDRDKCFSDAVVFGTYESTTAIGRETGDLGPNERAYHVDYYAPKRHTTIKFMKNAPGYKEAKRIASKVFSEKKVPE